MRFQETSLPGVFLVELEPAADERGWFARTFCKREFAAIGFREEFVQANQSFNRLQGTFRGLHYQLPPMHEAKLIRCVSGRVADLVVDLRKGSTTFLNHLQVELSAANARMILVPAGIAHGFLTLDDDTSLVYQHTQYHSRELERGVRVDDPRLGLRLPAPIARISPRDRSHPWLPPDFEGIEIPSSSS